MTRPEEIFNSKKELIGYACGSCMRISSIGVRLKFDSYDNIDALQLSLDSIKDCCICSVCELNEIESQNTTVCAKCKVNEFFSNLIDFLNDLKESIELNITNEVVWEAWTKFRRYYQYRSTGDYLNG